jgi:2-polyprenyl-6-methoxyphenol hydroxylase-like FAD-dependent oxidoreductase
VERCAIFVPSAIPARGNPSRTGMATLARSLPERRASESARRPLLRTPIAEYVPTRLVAGRMALIGPMTGSGFHYALLDVLSLRQVLAGTDRERVAQRLIRFEQARLADDRQLALYGQRWSRDYLASL